MERSQGQIAIGQQSRREHHVVDVRVLGPRRRPPVLGIEPEGFDRLSQRDVAPQRRDSARSLRLHGTGGVDRFLEAVDRGQSDRESKLAEREPPPRGLPYESSPGPLLAGIARQAGASPADVLRMLVPVAAVAGATALLLGFTSPARSLVGPRNQLGERPA